MSTRHSIVDYALQRRALLARVRSGGAGAFDVCDAHPYLQRAAQYHGEPTETSCPICRKEQLTLVHYVYGDDLRHISGQAKKPAEIERLAAAHREFTVYAVEVCRGCGWNFLTRSYVLGDLSEPDAAPRPARRRRAAQD